MKKMMLFGMAGVLLLTLAAQAGAAGKQSGFGYRGWGLRGGVSSDPDQIFVGGQLDLGEFVPNLRFKPNATIGFGDDITLVSLNPDISYAFPMENLGAIYVGGLLTFEWWKVDVSQEVKHLAELAGTSVDDTDTDVGVHVFGGLELESMPLFFELNVGLSDEAPDLKAAVGYSFE
jgi:hypothetical protein